MWGKCRRKCDIEWQCRFPEVWKNYVCRLSNKVYQRFVEKRAEETSTTTKSKKFRRFGIIGTNSEDFSVDWFPAVAFSKSPVDTNPTSMMKC